MFMGLVLLVWYFFFGGSCLFSLAVIKLILLKSELNVSNLCLKNIFQYKNSNFKFESILDLKRVSKKANKA